MNVFTPVPFGPTYNVSTLTPLIGNFLISGYDTVIITIQNLDSTHTVTLVVDPSTSGVVFNTTQRQQSYALPLEEGSVTIQTSAYQYIRVSAQTDGPSYPTVQVKFQINGSKDI